MTLFMEIRDRIRGFISRHEAWVSRIWHGVLCLIAFLVIDAKFGYVKALTHPALAIVIAALCAFAPVSASTVVVILFLLFQLVALDAGIALFVLVLVVISWIACSVYHAGHKENLIGMTVFQTLRLPLLLPTEGGLLCSINEVTSVICGSILAYYLKAVSENTALITDDTDPVSAIDLLISDLISNPMFYLYLSACIAAFLVAYLLRCTDMDHAWLIALTFSVLAGFVILLGADLFLGRFSDILSLSIGSAVSYLIGLLTMYIFRDLDYTRVERVQFEDDDYYYYVTAVPKIRLAEEISEVKQITHPSNERKGKEK